MSSHWFISNSVNLYSINLTTLKFSLPFKTLKVSHQGPKLMLCNVKTIVCMLWQGALPQVCPFNFNYASVIVGTLCRLSQEDILENFPTFSEDPFLKKHLDGYFPRKV